MNKLIKLTEKQKRSIEIKTVGLLTKLLNNASEIELTERIEYMVKRFETILNEEKSILTFENLELKKDKESMQASLRDMANQLSEAKMNVEQLKMQIK